jgi:sporulation protein YlmC with PRC-barrel domain
MEQLMTKNLMSVLLLTSGLLASGAVLSQEMPVIPNAGAPSVSAPATSGVSIQDYTSRVLALNQVSPAQNPQYRRGTKALSNRLIDQNRRGLGSITDITIGEGGKLLSIEASVMASGFNESMTFDVASYNVNAESDAYTVTLTRKQVQRNTAQFLAGIETAAGDEVMQPITVKSLVGGRVQTNKGNQIAVVNDVLIDEKRKAAVALLLTLMSGSGRTTIAVPYADAKIERVGNKATVELTEDQARIISQFAKKN